MLGSSKCAVVAQKLHPKGILCSYRVSAEAPPFSKTFSTSRKIQVSLVIESSYDVVVNKMVVGEFEYTDQQDHKNSVSKNLGQAICKKRKLSVDLQELVNSPPKKSVCRDRSEKNESICHYAQVDSASSYSSPNSNCYGPVTSLCGARQTGYFPSQNSLRPAHLVYSGPESISSPTLKSQSLPSGLWGSHQNPSTNFSRSPGLVSNSATHLTISSGSTASSPSTSQNLPLYRISTYQQSSCPVGNPHLQQSKQQFNAYSLYPNKAKVEIVSDLATMTQGWTDQEIKNRRRLVYFSRVQSGSTITTDFRPLLPTDHPEPGSCVSCIHWKEKKDCFVTSVDTIQLLQFLVDANFTVEEKNRIRRNLEGFRPITVSKVKSECEEFFKVIMAFPSPKPRNIEKDVKIFHWSDLSSALKKIIGKYVG